MGPKTAFPDGAHIASPTTPAAPAVTVRLVERTGTSGICIDIIVVDGAAGDNPHGVPGAARGS